MTDMTPQELTALKVKFYHALVCDPELSAMGLADRLAVAVPIPERGIVGRLAFCGDLGERPGIIDARGTELDPAAYRAGRMVQDRAGRGTPALQCVLRQLRKGEFQFTRLPFKETH